MPGVPVLALLVLSPIGAELLAAYNDTTGRPLALLGNLVFFAALYGCPALLIRELARRTGRGWPAILLLSAAAGLLQAGVLDQSLFSESYDDVRGWEEIGARDLRRAARRSARTWPRTSSSAT